MTVESLYRTLDQELIAIIRGAVPGSNGRGLRAEPPFLALIDRRAPLGQPNHDDGSGGDHGHNGGGGEGHGKKEKDK